MPPPPPGTCRLTPTPTRHVPAGFNFGYMVAWGQASVVDKFVPGLGGKTDPVGPSPVIIHVEMLKQAAWAGLGLG